MSLKEKMERARMPLPQLFMLLALMIFGWLAMFKLVIQTKREHTKSQQCECKCADNSSSPQVPVQSP